MVRRLLKNGHECVVHDLQPSAAASLVEDGATGAASLQEMVVRLVQPRAIWLMVPAAVVDQALGDLVPLLDAGDSVVDGGNSYYRDDMRRGAQLRTRGVHYLDIGTSGGVAGLERGYCLMIGGEADGEGFLHCGPHGAGHFVKMVHNGIEYGVMAAYAQGLNILRNANLGKRDHQPEQDAETEFSNRILSAMRHEFGGHVEKPAP